MRPDGSIPWRLRRTDPIPDFHVQGSGNEEPKCSRFFQKFGGRSCSILQVHPTYQRKLMHGDPRRLRQGASGVQPSIFRKLTRQRKGIMRRTAGINVRIRTQEVVSIFPLSKTLNPGRIARRPSRRDDDRRSPWAGVKAISCCAPANRTRFPA